MPTSTNSDNGSLFQRGKAQFVGRNSVLAYCAEWLHMRRKTAGYRLFHPTALRRFDLECQGLP